MKKLTWWCRIVGGFNLLLGTANTIAVFALPKMFEDGIPYAHTADTTKAFIDAWFPFALDMVVIGVALLWISRKPAEQLGVVWIAVAGEALHGIVADAFLIGRGYDPGGYIAFMAVHLAIVVTGALFARSAASSRPKVASPSGVLAAA